MSTESVPGNSWHSVKSKSNCFKIRSPDTTLSYKITTELQSSENTKSEQRTKNVTKDQNNTKHQKWNLLLFSHQVPMEIQKCLTKCFRRFLCQNHNSTHHNLIGRFSMFGWEWFQPKTHLNLRSTNLTWFVSKEWNLAIVHKVFEDLTSKVF